MLASSCASTESVSSDEFADLKADVEKFSADVEALTYVAKTTKKELGWPEDYQESWRDICGCTLKGLMGAFTLKDYESWPQDVKDGAASPYLSMCWAK